MEKEIAFGILNMEETKEEAEIQSAYHVLLRSVNPEDDPEGFKRLRMAFETAMDNARRGDDEQEEENLPKSEVDLWIDRVEKFYEKLPTRSQQNGWRELLADPVCDELDTSLEAREKMLVFLMNHIHLPHDIWKMLDDAFGFIDDLNELEQMFPGNFLSYLKYYVENETFFPYDVFQYRDAEKGDIDGDSYIEGLMGVKKKLDSGEEDGCLQELEDLRVYNIYHPYEDVERLRLYTREDNTEECNRLIALLTDKIPEDHYCRLYIGEAYQGMGEKEKAYSIWEKLLEESPDFYQVKYNVANYLLEKGDNYEARELMHELLDKDGNDERVQKMLERANEVLIPEYRGKLERGEEDEHFPGGELVLELGWCLFQNDKLDEAIGMLDDFTPEEKEEYGYYNLFGRLLYQAKQYDRAVSYLEKWKEMLWGLEEDGTDETKKRISRKNMAASILGACYYELGKKEDALKSIRESIDVAADAQERHGSMQQMAGLLLQYKEYEDVIDVCDRLIREDEGYYPAYLIRQEACFELHKGQEVVDDYHRAIEIYPGFYRPYLFAAEVFYFYRQYEDALNVLNLAQENGISLTPRMRLDKAKILREKAENAEERREPFQILEELSREIEDENKGEDFDIEDTSEVASEKALLYWDEDNHDKAILYIKKAIKENPERLQYHLLCGNIHVDCGKYRVALREYQAAEPEYSDSASLYYGRGMCYEGLGAQTLAIENFEKALQCRDVYADAAEKVSDYYNKQYHKTYKREYLEKALEYASRQVEAAESCYSLVNRGLIYMNAMELEPAIEDFKKALTYREDDWPAWNNLGCCYKYKGEFQEGIECFKKAAQYMEGDEDILPYSNMADCYEALGEYQKAIECYQEDLKIASNDSDFWMEIGELYTYMGKYQEALEAFENTKGKDGYHEDYYRRVGSVWIKKGDLRKGIGYYKKGIKVASGPEKARRYYELGQLYTDELMDHKKAVSCFKHAMEYTNYYSDWFDFERYAARAYYRLGDKENAKKHAKRALEFFEKAKMGAQKEYLNFKPYAPIHLETFGWIFLCLGQEQKAEQYFQKMEQTYRCRNCRYQSCFENRLYLGDLYFFQGKREQAKKAYHEALERNPHCDEALAALKFMEKNKK